MRKILNDNMGWMILAVLVIVGGVFVYGVFQIRKNKKTNVTVNNTNTGKDLAENGVESPDDLA